MFESGWPPPAIRIWKAEGSGAGRQQRAAAGQPAPHTAYSAAPRPRPRQQGAGCRAGSHRHRAAAEARCIVIMRVVAIASFSAQQEGDLSFAQGKHIVVVSQDGGDWWEGYVEGQPAQRGSFPRNYVEPAGPRAEDEEGLPPKSACADVGAGGGEAPKAGWVWKKGGSKVGSSSAAGGGGRSAIKSKATGAFGKKGGWGKRFLQVTARGMVVWSKDAPAPGDAPPSDELDLRQLEVHANLGQKEGLSSREYGFSLVGAGRELLFGALSERDKEEWVAFLRRAKEMLSRGHGGGGGGGGEGESFACLTRVYWVAVPQAWRARRVNRRRRRRRRRSRAAGAGGRAAVAWRWLGAHDIISRGPRQPRISRESGLAVSQRRRRGWRGVWWRRCGGRCVLFGGRFD
jgi:hypothetical protein